jgi:hypothetical protein
VISSFVYRVACAGFQPARFAVALKRAKELEIIVLRHELAIARPQLGRPRPAVADRALLAALRKFLPRLALSAFAVSPTTLLPWHHQLVGRHWTNDRRSTSPTQARSQETRARLSAHRQRASESSGWPFLPRGRVRR